MTSGRNQRYVRLSPHTIVTQMTTPTKLFSISGMSLRDKIHILFHKRIWFRITNDDARRLSR